MIPIPPVRGPLPAQVAHLLLVTGHGVSRLLDAGATWDDWRAYDLLGLRVAAQQGSCATVPAELGRALLCRRQTASAIVTRLEAAGLAVPTPLADGRHRGVRLTDAGWSAIEQADFWLTNVGNRALADLDASSQTRVENLLERIDLALREEFFEQEVRWGTDRRHLARRPRRA